MCLSNLSSVEVGDGRMQSLPVSTLAPGSLRPSLKKIRLKISTANTDGPRMPGLNYLRQGLKPRQILNSM